MTGEMVTVHDVIACSGLGANGHAGFHERPDVAVNGAQADVESVSDFLSLHDLLPLQLNKYSG
ncbi:hypothetical protein WJU16_15225 [Chitinophaga pollutisoli]|uniref:Uncharacterized protein n=1 Tax=Chitinophaga pollutisoli TaxID=3133966 RepID=A0ABZ2YKC9_9BACT